MGTSYLWFRKMLAEHVSSDPTRFVLTSIHYDGEGWFVATNGQRLLAVREKLLELDYSEKPEAGAGYHSGAFRKGELYRRTQGVTFPDWRKVIPSGAFKAVLRAKLPQWLTARPKRPGARSCSLVVVGLKSEHRSLSEAASTGPLMPELRLGHVAGDGVLAGIDLRYLRPYALRASVCIGVHEPEEPIIFAETPEAVREPLGASWFGMVMGLRLSLPDDPILSLVEG